MHQANIIKNNPKPAVFVARKLFCDFANLADRKIETILAQSTKERSIFKSLQKDVDPIYDQLLEAIGSISEHCLPSLLKISLDWYHQQLGSDENVQRRPNSLCENHQQQQQQHQSIDHQPSERGSPCNETLNSISSTIRSPTPSSPDTSNQISILSTLPLDYQSPPLTVINESHSSAANTSTSTATNVSSNSLLDDSSNNFKRLELIKTRKLLIEFTFCQLLIEIFNQLYLHPGHEDLIGQIKDIAFEHFRYVEGNELYTADLANVNQLADKFAEVIGVLAQTRFKSVRKRFMSELNELRAIKEPSSYNIHCIVTLLSGLRYFRVKMAPIEEFEASFQFLQELADYFIEVRHKSIKHALAGLFVEIMVPLASIVKNEVKIPCLKSFVDTLWIQTLDMCSRKKHSITLFPLVTCLLCVSQRAVFLANWGVFLNMCLTNLKNRDQKMCRVVIEALYRLIWIYMIRVKCESNIVTQSRLQSVVDAVFPKGSRSVVPRDTSISIFVDIIYFIAQERLDFAMRHIIFDLLSVDRPLKVIVAPERMNIALQAFLVIIESLLKKEGDPPMPISLGSSVTTVFGSGSKNASTSNHNNHSNITNNSNNNSNTTANNKILTDDIAKSIGMFPYFANVQKVFGDILKALDTQYGRPLLLTVANSTSNKELDNIITSEIRPKIDLFRTCLKAIPRLLPEGMPRSDLIELLSRLTIHVDEEMRRCAFQTLQVLIVDLPSWRFEVVEGFTLFLVNQIDDSMRHLVDRSLKTLLQLMISWRNAITVGGGSLSTSSQTILGCYSGAGPHNSMCRSNTINIQTGYETISSRHGGSGGQIAARKNRALAEMRLIQSELNNLRFDKLVNVIQKVEGASFVMLCNCQSTTRNLANQLLRESRRILKYYTSWTSMEQSNFKSPDEGEEEDLSASLRGSLSADNLSRITAASINGQALSCSVTSMNKQAVLSSSISRMCISNQHQKNRPCHLDPYDSDLENNLDDGSAKEDSSSLIFCTAVIMLDSTVEKEYLFGLDVLKNFLPSLSFEQPEFMEEFEKNLLFMKRGKFIGLHSLILRRVTSSTTYAPSIVLLDQLTPVLLHPLSIGTGKEQAENENQHKHADESIFPIHVIVLLTQLLSEYEDPTPFSMNIASRIAIWCDEKSQKLENLSAVLTLYSRRSFSKDGFQWTKCVIKYLYDAYQESILSSIPILVDMLEYGSDQVQHLIPPIIYCIFSYIDISQIQTPSTSLKINTELSRLYNLLLNGGTEAWRDAIQIFKLLISRSSYLATNSTTHGRELPGRVMDFSFEVEQQSVSPTSDHNPQQQQQQHLEQQPPTPIPVTTPPLTRNSSAATVEVMVATSSPETATTTPTIEADTITNPNLATLEDK